MFIVFWLLPLSASLSPIVLSGCKYDACDEAREKAERACRDRGLEPQNCRQTKHETTLFSEECEYECECVRN